MKANCLQLYIWNALMDCHIDKIIMIKNGARSVTKHIWTPVGPIAPRNLFFMNFHPHPRLQTHAVLWSSLHFLWLQFPFTRAIKSPVKKQF